MCYGYANSESLVSLMAVPARPRIACIWPVKFLVFSGTIKLRERYLVIRFLILCFRQELDSRRTVQKEHGLIAR